MRKIDSKKWWLKLFVIFCVKITQNMEGNYVYKYPHPAVTTDCVIFGYDTKEGLSVLLVKRGIEPYKDYWAFPGGIH